jgi:histone H3/H4
MSSQKLKNQKKAKEPKRDVFSQSTSDYEEEGFEIQLGNSKLNMSNTDEIETPVQTPISSKKKEKNEKAKKDKNEKKSEKAKKDKNETKKDKETKTTKPEGIKKKKHDTYTSSMPNLKDKMQGIQSGVKNIFTKTSIAHLIKDTIHERGSESTRITRGALDLIHEKVEQYMANVFWTANILAKTRKVMTVGVQDLKLATIIQNGDLNMNIHKSKIDPIIPEMKIKKKK